MTFRAMQLTRRVWFAGALGLMTVSATFVASMPTRASAAHFVGPSVRGAYSFHGSCVSFRNRGWGIAQSVSNLQTTFWNRLQVDYNSNYPPPELGGSIPGLTVAQVAAATADMHSIEKKILGHVAQDTSYEQTGHEPGGLSAQRANWAVAHGLPADDLVAGPYSWANRQLGYSLQALALAAIQETQKPGSGLDEYHTSQETLTYSWQALKQLPCNAVPTRHPSSRPPNAALSLLNVQLSDLASGYRPITAGYKMIPLDNYNPVAYNDRGAQQSYSALYVHQTGSVSGPFGYPIASYVLGSISRYATTSAAHTAFQQNRTAMRTAYLAYLSRFYWHPVATGPIGAESQEWIVTYSNEEIPGAIRALELVRVGVYLIGVELQWLQNKGNPATATSQLTAVIARRVVKRG